MSENIDVLIWLILGLALLISEVFTGTFHLLFFGLAGLLTAAATYAGVHSIPLQLVVFALLSGVCVYVLRKRLVGHSQGFTADVDSLIKLTKDIPPGRESTVSYQGSPWTVVNSSAATLHAGDQARVVRTEGNKLILDTLKTEE